MNRARRWNGLAADDSGGRRTPFVWAHGLTSSRAAEDAAGLFPWSAIDGLRVIRYDARGHGASGGPADPAAYEWGALAADLVALLDAADLEHSAIGGASMGCATALGAALLAPDRIDRLVLVIPPTAWSTRLAQRTMYEDAARLVETSGIASLVELGWREEPLPVLGEVGERVRSGGLERLGSMDPIVLPHILRGAAASDLPAPEALAGITRPALILAWTDDPGHPVSTAQVLANALPDVELDIASDLAAIRRWPSLVKDFLLAREPS